MDITQGLVEEIVNLIVDGISSVIIRLFLRPHYLGYRFLVKNRPNLLLPYRWFISSSTPKLPPEIWINIIGFVLEPYSAPYNHCNSRNYPTYHIRNHYHYVVGDTEHEALASDYKSIRLVCKEWAAIAYPYRAMVLKDQEMKFLVGVKRLIVEYDFSYLNRLLSMPLVACQLRDVVLPHYMLRKSGQIRPLELLLYNSECFPQIRSLTLGDEGIPPNFWSRLQRAYPLLVSLRILSSVLQPGSLSLHRLEILDIVQPRGVHVKFNLPALRHCCMWSDYRTSSDELVGFLRDNGDRLESLTIPRYQSQRPEILISQLWHLCPRLQLIGFAESILQTGYTGTHLPDDHPLNHLYIPFLGESRMTLLTRFEKMQHTILSLRIRRISIECSQLSIVDELLLKRFWARRNIQVSWVPTPRYRDKRSVLKKWFDNLEL